jgi:hypothetical protein
MSTARSDQTIEARIYYLFHFIKLSQNIFLLRSPNNLEAQRILLLSCVQPLTIEIQ